ncbi:MAG: T9SS type A sorting domain-containing protein [Saprospiraceae bacterium]
MKEISRLLILFFCCTLLNSADGQTAIGGCSSVKITSQLFDKKLIEEATIINVISQCEKVIDLAPSGWGHARIWLQKKNASGVFEDYFLNPIRSRVPVSASVPDTYGEVTFTNLPHGVYRGKVQVPVNYYATCGLIMYHRPPELNVGWQAVMSEIFFTGEAIVGPTVASDISYTFLDGGGGDANPTAFDFGEEVRIDATASKNYDLYWLAIFELSGAMRYWSQGWTSGSTLGVANLSQKWENGGTPPWEFESLGSYRVQFAIENSKCINPSWTGLERDFFICPAGSGCRFADEAYSALRVSPNPAAGSFQILGFDASLHPASRLVVSDLSGRQIKSVLASEGDVGISDLPNGMYVVTLWDNSARLFSDKLVISQ